MLVWISKFYMDDYCVAWWFLINSYFYVVRSEIFLQVEVRSLILLSGSFSQLNSVLYITSLLALLLLLLHFIYHRCRSLRHQPHTNKYHVSCINGKISVRIKLDLPFSSSSHSIVVFFFPVGLLSLSRYFKRKVYRKEKHNYWMGRQWKGNSNLILTIIYLPESHGYVVVELQIFSAFLLFLEISPLFSWFSITCVLLRLMHPLSEYYYKGFLWKEILILIFSYDFFLIKTWVPGLNPKSFCSAFIVQAYVLLIAIYPSVRDVKLGCPSVHFDKSRLMPEQSFFFSLPHLIFITHILHHNTILTQIHLSLTSPTWGGGGGNTSPCNVVHQSDAKIENGSQSQFRPSKVESKHRKGETGRY